MADENDKAVANEEDLDDLEGEESSESSRPKSRLPGKKIVLFAGVPVFVLILGAGLYLSGVVEMVTGEPVEEGEQKEETKDPTDIVFYDLPDMLVNLSSTNRKTHYLRISVSLELEDSDDISILEAVLPRVVDNFQVYLRELRVEDLRGSAGLYRLREELLKRVSAAAAPAKINDVLFKEMLIQ